ncbi:hypothetical protein J437_LFUL004640 [Ladona fulva]|uniref:PWWP domain-containing protein n=1 Tax=Ladona fulva TaxID=123851 RepID=A0A8K0NYW0_LADFU|nr:hypothetical protein J437_LFUL004640 [Ladona fulva]
MCELSEFTYAEGSVVWVKLGSCWWPGEVKNVDDLPEEILQNLKKRPFTAVKFFDEDKYEYVRNLDNICLYNNRRKNEFIRKGLDMARAKAKEGSSVMKKFPNDVVTAECRTGGDPNILTSEAFAPQERPNYREIFGESPGKRKSSKKNSTPKSFGDKRPGRPPSNGQSKVWKDLEIPSPAKVVPKITHRRFISESDHEVRIRQQPCTPPKDDASTPTNNYKCHMCDFTSSRLNVIVLHNKAQHSESAIAAAKLQTPTTGKKRKISNARLASSSTGSKQKIRKCEVKDPSSGRAKRNIMAESEKKVGVVESVGEKSNSNVRKKGKGNTKKKRDTEVRESLLADWGEVDEEEEEKEIENLKMVLGSSRILEVESHDEKKDEPEPPEKEASSEKVEAEVPVESPEKAPEKPADESNLEEEFESLMEETAMPLLPEVPSVKATLPENEKEVADAEKEITDGDAVNEEDSTDEKPEVAKELSDNKVDTEISNDCGPQENKAKEGNLPLEAESASSDASLQHSEKSQVPLPQTNMISVSSPTNEKISAPQESESLPQTTSANQGTLGIMPVVSEPPKTSSVETTSEALPPSTVVEPARTLVSAAPSEEATETATYVLVTIDDSGALQPIDNMNTVVNTALLALDGQQDDGPRTLYIDPSQLGTQGTDLENIFLAIDTRGDMTTQMVELANRGGEQTDVAGQTFSASAAKAKSAQDILAVALANTQVFQGDASYVALNPAASAVTVTSSRHVTGSVMTSRVLDPCRNSAANAVPISNAPTISELPASLGEVQRPLNMPAPATETPAFQSNLQPTTQNVTALPAAINPTPQAAVTLPASMPHLNSDDSTNRLDTSVSNILNLPYMIPSTHASAGIGNGQNAATLTLIGGTNLIMDQVTQALPKVDSEGVVEPSHDHVAEKRKLECDVSEVSEPKQMRVDENGGS